MRSPITRLKTNFDLKSTYFLRLELGFILSLLISITAFKVNVNLPEETDDIYVQTQEEVYLDEIVRTKQIEQAPPPPRPLVPVEVPNDEVLEDEEEIFVVVEQMPELIGGLSGLQKQIVYPQMAILAQIEGRVIVQFVIDKTGSVGTVEVVRGIGGGCDEEAVRVIRTAKFKPGLQRGKPVSVKYSIPVVFNLKSSKKSKPNS